MIWHRDKMIVWGLALWITCTCVESVLLLKDKSYGPVRTFYLHGFLQAPFHRGQQLRQAAKAKAYTLCSRGGAGTQTHRGDTHPARGAEMAFPIAPNPTRLGASPAGFTPWIGVVPPDTLPSTAPTSSRDFSNCIPYFVPPWLVHHLPCLSPSWPFTSLPKASGLFVTFLQSSLLLLSLISLHRPSSFLKNYLLILCQWDPFPPVSWSVSKRSFCTKRHLQAASRSLWNSAWALSQRGCRWWKALVALECAFFPVCFH